MTVQVSADRAFELEKMLVMREREYLLLIGARNSSIHDDAAELVAMVASENLAKIRHCLNLLKSNEYGLCLECMGEIAEGRLKALPFAIRCCTCEEEHEMKKRLSQRPTLAGGYLEIRA